MRVLVLTHLHPSPWLPNKGVFNEHQFRALSRRAATRLIVPLSWIKRLCVVPKFTALSSVIGDRLDNISTHYPRLVYPPRILQGWHGQCYRFCVRATFLKACEDFRPDLVFAAWAYPDGWAAVELGHEVGLPVVIKVHGSDVLRVSSGNGKFKPTVAALRSADGVMAVSRNIAECLRMWNVPADHIRVIYDGVDAALFHPGDREGARRRLGLEDHGVAVILYVGRLAPVKGIEDLIGACALLRARNVPFCCYIVGEGPLRGRLLKAIASENLQGRIQLMGVRSHRDLPDWYRAADVLVLPSYSEGVPCALLEAAACHTPFVATRVGGVAEIAHLGTNKLVAPRDRQEIADAIQQFLSHETRSGDSKTIPRSHDDAAAELFEFFEQVLARKKRVSPAATASTPRIVPGSAATSVSVAGRLR